MSYILLYYLGIKFISVRNKEVQYLPVSVRQLAKPDR